jgi:DNA-binding CsgD family transcriptional regulator
VKTHLAALFHKLAVSTRAEAVAAGARAGVILL